MALAPGTKLGPYEILSPLGAGGMGQVFRARDSRLGRDVAIKVLPDHLADDPKALRRFQDEAKAVAALSHPNILALFDVGEANGTRYAVTELLEGETLRALVTRGPVPVRRALEIASRLADALAAAHDRGIVHRDVKPENVFVTRDGHVKLLDFGLARQATAFADGWDTHLPTASARTEPGVVTGTVAYMSPEQTRGLPVDFRTDQFSLGVTLYEMLAGHRPFRGSTSADVHAAILTKEPEPLPGADPPVPGAVCVLLDRCLAKEPRDRYDSSRDLARDLTAWREQVSGARTSGSPVSASSGRVAPADLSSRPGGADSAAERSAAARRPLIAAVATVALVLAASLGIRAWRGGSGEGGGASESRPRGVAAAALDPKRTVVAVFENRTGDPSLDSLGRTIAERIVDRLVEIGLDVVPSPQVPPTPGPSPGAGSAKDAAQRLAAAHDCGVVVTGVYTLSGEDVQIQARATDATKGRVLFPIDPVRAPRSRVAEAVDAVRLRTVDAVATHELGLAKPELGLVDTLVRAPRYEALLETDLAYDVTIDLPAAIRHTERAIELDPDFALPYVDLAFFQMMRLGQPDEAIRSLERAERLQRTMTPSGRLWLGWWKGFLLGRHEEALAKARGWAELAPEREERWHTVAIFLNHVNRPREAVAVLRKPLAWERVVGPGKPNGHQYLLNLTSALHVLGEHDAELVAAERCASLYPDSVDAHLPRLGALAALGRAGAVEAAVGEVATLTTRSGTNVTTGEGGLAGRAIRHAALELRAHGHPQDALKMAARLVDWCALRAAPGDPEASRLHADGLRLAGRFAEARSTFLALASANPDDLEPKGQLGALAALLGDTAEARRIDADLLRRRSPYVFGRDLYARALVAAQMGEKERAVELLRAALSAGFYVHGVPYPFAFHLEPWLEPLRGHPSYEALVRPRG